MKPRRPLLAVLPLVLSLLCAGVLSSCLDSGDCTPVEAQKVDEVNNLLWDPPVKTGATALQFTSEKNAYSLSPVYQSGLHNYGGTFLLGSALRKTTDGGATWKPINAPLADAYFVDGNTGWAVGSEGAVLKTSNGGQAWTTQKSGTENNLLSVYFVNALQGCAVGAAGTILRTLDGGATWTLQKSGTTDDLTAVQFTSADNGYAVGNGVVLKTVNGGKTWSVQVIGQEHNYYLSSIHFTDALRGWIGGDGWESDRILTYKTTDGGKRWVEQNGSLDVTVQLEGVVSIQFTEAQVGWALAAIYDHNGFGYMLFKTSDAGLTWTASTSILASNLAGAETRSASFFFLNSETGWLAAGNTRLTTQNGGGTWEASGGGVTAPLASQQFLNPGRGYAVGVEGTIFRTDNGGVSWTAQRGGMPADPTAFFFVDSSLGWVTGLTGAISKTTDGGKLWSSEISGTDQDLLSVHFLNAQAGYAVGESGTIVKTQDGGATWNPVPSGTTRVLRAVRFADAQTGYAAGDGGTLLRTGNGGAAWVAQASGTPKNLTSIAIPGGNQIIVTGGGTGDPDPEGDVYSTNPNWSHGVLLRSGDGGANWVQQDSSVTPLKLYSVAFVDANVGFAVGGGPSYVSYPDIGGYDYYCTDYLAGYFTQILITTDGGFTWTPEQTVRQARIQSSSYLTAGDPLLSVSCSASGECAAAGATQILLRK